MSNLEVHWNGKGRLNAKESDLQFKYHVARLSNVYRGRSGIDNKEPFTYRNPPPRRKMGKETGGRIGISSGRKESSGCVYVKEKTTKNDELNIYVPAAVEHPSLDEVQDQSDRKQNVEGERLTPEEIELLEGHVHFTAAEKQVYDSFVDMLVHLDGDAVSTILRNVKEDVRRRSMLDDYNGTVLSRRNKKQQFKRSIR